MVLRHRWLISMLVMVALAAALALLAPGGRDSLANGTTFYVDADAMGTNDGSSWANAFTDLQAALTAAGSGTEIWVAAGIYKPTSGTDRSAAFQMKNGVALYGGFDPSVGDDAFEDRDWQTNETILSGDLNGDDGPDFANNGENSYYVFYHPTGTDLDSTAVLDGFTVSGGNSPGRCGGMYNSSSSPTLTNVTFEGNSADSGGGGMCNYSSSPALTNCSFRQNRAPGNAFSAGRGGGIYNGDSSPVLTNCTFDGNSADEGGGMYNYNASSPTLTNVTFAGNSATYGGGIYNYSSSPTLTDCTVEGNSADVRGGGMYNNDSSSPTLTNCTFEGNTASSFGGGMLNHQGSSPALSDCTFSGNSADWGGGMANLVSSSPTLTNCTFDGNSGAAGGGMSNRESSSPTLSDCTFSGNSASSGGGMHNYEDSSPALTNCTFESNSAATRGGGMANNDSSSPELTNCTFESNSAGYGGGIYNYSSTAALIDCTFNGNSAVTFGGGGMYNDSSSPALTNCTFEGNSAVAFAGGGMYNYSSSPVLTNCILWGDTPDEIYNNSSSPVVTYSDIQGSYTGAGNINADPLFVDMATGDLRLQLTSPAIDAGDSSAPGLIGITTDLGGNPRFAGVIDMGAYEAPHNPTFVDIDATGANDGTSWDDALTSLQDALAWAQEGVEIRVAAGTYMPSQEFAPGDPRSATYQMVNGVALYGGFDPSVGGTAFEDRDWDAHPTILSGDIGVGDDPSDNVYHVFYHPAGMGLDSSAILDGFTVAGGNASSATGPHSHGGGMYNEGSSPTLTNCTFEDNSADAWGGGMFIHGPSSPTLTNCIFSGNKADFGGGMLAGDSASPALANCTFAGNSAGSAGGGMFNDGSTPTLTNCTFAGNSADAWGGGMAGEYSSSTLTNCILWGDTAGGLPSEIYGDPANVTYSDIQGGYDGVGNIDADPRFVDAAGGDYHLGPGSPCIDVGDNAAPTLPPYDFEGDDRIRDGDGDGTPIVDMGVDEALWLPVYLPLALRGY